LRFCQILETSHMSLMDNSPNTEKNRKINNKNYERSHMKTFPLVFLFFMVLTLHEEHKLQVLKIFEP
jgi:hypothetical protein